MLRFFLTMGILFGTASFVSANVPMTAIANVLVTGYSVTDLIAGVEPTIAIVCGYRPSTEPHASELNMGSPLAIVVSGTSAMLAIVALGLWVVKKQIRGNSQDQ